jgi:hypothetical protein
VAYGLSRHQKWRSPAPAVPPPITTSPVCHGEVPAYPPRDHLARFRLFVHRKAMPEWRLGTCGTQTGRHGSSIRAGPEARRAAVRVPTVRAPWAQPRALAPQDIRARHKPLQTWKVPFAAPKDHSAGRPSCGNAPFGGRIVAIRVAWLLGEGAPPLPRGAGPGRCGAADLGLHRYRGTMADARGAGEANRSQSDRHPTLAWSLQDHVARARCRGPCARIPGTEPASPPGREPNLPREERM